MTNVWTGTQRLAREAARVAYLRRWGLLTGLPSDREDVSDAQSERLAAVAVEMRAAGLFGKQTPMADIRAGIRRCVRLAKEGPV